MPTCRESPGLLFVLVLAGGCASGRHRDPERALASCSQAFGDVAAAATPTVTMRAAVLRSCSALWADRACRSAVERASDPAAVDRAHLRCRDRYCPILPEPKPLACGSAAGETISGVLALELHQAALGYDLGLVGPERDRMAAVAYVLFGPSASIPVALPIDAVREDITTTLAVTLAYGPGGVDLYVDGRRLGTGLSSPPSPQELAPLLAVVPQGAREVRVVVAADRRVPHGTVVGVIEGLKTRGVTRFAVDVQPEP